MNFSELGLSEKLVAKVTAAGLTTPTPIQDQAIPHVLNGRDLMGLAQTGTGKTAAFGLPLIDILMGVGSKPAPKTVRGLILAPTRELAKQISDNLKVFTEKTHLKIGLVVGGVSINAQIKRLQNGTDIVVATPGRLLDLLDRRSIDLSQTAYLVLDEADQMLDLGFVHALRKIATFLPAERQTLLFSATMPKLMAEISATYLKSPVRVEVSPPGKTADKVTQSVHFVAQGAKLPLLKRLIDEHRSDLALVFVRTKHGAEKMMKNLDAAGFAAGSIHGNKSQGQRDRALAAFKEGRLKVLVATDVAARGIDIPDVRHVYNFDLPNVAENYVHRIGRTARAGKAGAAIAFCSEGEMGELRSIEKVTGQKISVAGGVAWEGAQEAASPKGGRRRGPGGGGGGNKSGKPGSFGKPKSFRPRRSKSGGQRQRSAA